MHRTDRTVYVERKPNTRVKKMKPPISPARKTRRTSSARVIAEKGLKTEYFYKTLWMGTALQIQLMKRTKILVPIKNKEDPLVRVYTVQF